MLVGIYVGAWLGAGILTGANAKPAAIGLGLSLIVYAALGLSKIHFLDPAQRRNLGRPAGRRRDRRDHGGDRRFRHSRPAQLNALGFQRDELVQALGVHFSISTFALAAVLWSGSAFDFNLGLLSLAAIVPAVSA